MFAADARETGTVRGGVCRDFATVQRQRRTCGDVRAATGETRDVTLDSGVGQDERRSAVHAHAGPCLDATLDTTRELDTLAELCEYMKMPPPISAWFSSNANPLKSACAFV